MVTATVKVSRYAQRNNDAHTVPMELDSDPDFNPGAYIPEQPKEKVKKLTKKGRKGTKREREEDSEDEVKTAPKAKRYRPQANGNPLLKYFAQHEIEKFKNVVSEDEDEEDSDKASADSGTEDRALLESTLRSVRPQSGSSAPGQNPDLHYSDTESQPDTDFEKRNPELHYSTTDEGSDFDDKPAVVERPGLYDDTDEEDDDDDPVPVGSSLRPHPGFPLKDGQKCLPPLYLDADARIKICGPINTYLRPYQRDGAKFMYDCYKNNKGGVLGDDMGLGKTIQVTSFLSAIMKKEGTVVDLDRRKNRVSRLQDGEAWRKRKELPPANAMFPTALIIAPPSVVPNWERELQTWGYFEVGVHSGTKENRKQVIKDFKMGRLDIVISSFELVRRDIEELDTLPWSCIFVDEAHKLKNLTAKTTQAFHQFTCKLRFGLTGTAIQNSYEELYTILDWANPGMLGTPKQWKKFIQTPLTAGQSAKATDEERAKFNIVSETLTKRILPDFFLRRTKDIIKDQLPQKIDQVVFCPLAQVQLDAYRRIVDSDVVQNLLRKDEQCDCDSGLLRKKCCYPYEPADVLRHISILLKLSNHLALILPSRYDTPDQLKRNRELVDLVFPRGAPMFAEAVTMSHYCGKWDTLDMLLQEWRTDRTNKVLIFTKSVKLIEMLEFLLRERDYNFLTLDGSVKQNDRMPLIDQFQNDPNVFIFLISTLAGGTGLNLTSANRVVIFDPNWNPAHDLQAMDRAFRFGQTRDVLVFRLLGAGSLEEIIYARQLYKQQQMAIGYDASIQTRYFEGVQGNKDKQGELFGLKNLFSLNEDNLATKMAIEKANMAHVDWALENMPSKSKLSKDRATLVAADKANKEDDLHGLGALLFDDALPTAAAKAMAEEEILKKNGIRYTHRNDEILAPNAIAVRREKEVVRRARQSAGVPRGAGRGRVKKELGKPTAPWPPPRRGRAKLAPDNRLASRLQRIADMGLDDDGKFVATFARETPENQALILAKIDEWVPREEEPDDSD